MGYTGYAHQGMESIAQLGGGGEAAEKALGPIAKGIDLASAGATLTSSLQRNEPFDVAFARAAGPFVGSLLGARYGAQAGAAVGGLFGEGVGAIPGAVVGGVGGAQLGEKAGDFLADKYAEARGLGGC